MKPNHPFPQMPLAGSNPLLSTQPTFPDDTTRAQMNADIIARFNKIERDFIIECDTSVSDNPDEFCMVMAHYYSTTGTGGWEGGQVTCSESMGYGMMIAAYMAGAEGDGLATKTIGAKALTMKDYFDGMHRTHVRFPVAKKTTPLPFIVWEIVGDFTPEEKEQGRSRSWRYAGGRSPGSATDGDMDMAYAYLLAHEQWGSDGRYDYLQCAKWMIEGIWQNLVYPENHHLKIGDWVYANNASVTRPSDHILYQLRAFDLYSDHDWQRVVDALQDAIGQGTDPALRLYNTSSSGDNPPNATLRTGLMPGFQYLDRQTKMWRPSTGEWFVEGSPIRDRKYDYNACRVPWRLGTDIILYGDTAIRYRNNPQNADAWNTACTLGSASVEPVVRFILRGAPGQGGADGDFDAIKKGHFMDGTGWRGDGDSAYGGPIAVAACLYGSQKEVNNGWSYMRSLPREGYQYGDYIILLCMLSASGNVWRPGE